VTDLTEPVEEPPAEEPVPQASDPVEPDDAHADLERKNTRLGWALFGLFVLLFAGVWAVAYIYLALD
jgi:hypothetical protein